MELDFSTILAEAQGWLNWLWGILGGTGIAGIIALVYRGVKIIQSTKNSLEKNTGNLEQKVSEAVAKALPSNITFDMKGVADRKFDELGEKVNEVLLNLIKKQEENERLLLVMGTALSCLKSIPQSVKDEWAEVVGDKIKTAEKKLIISLIPSVKANEEKAEAEEKLEIKVEQEAEYVE